SCPSGTPTCAKVVLTRTDTREQTTLTTADATSKRYIFTNLIPATYSVAITGAGLLQTTSQITVLAGSTINYDIPVGIVQNTVSGQVTGPALGKSATVGPLNGVPVALGHLDTRTTPATFVIDKGTDGQDLITSTATNGAGIVGAFSFTTVNNGTYVAQYNVGASGNPAKAGYQSQVSTSFVNVTSGQATAFPPAQLVRVTHNVTLTVSTTDDLDVVSGSTGVGLTSAGDSTWTMSPLPVSSASITGGGNKYTWTFNGVPSGNWLTSITLPSGHFGTLAGLSGADSLTCAAGTESTPVACTSPGADSVQVSGSGSGADVTEAYQLDEFQAGLSVLAHPLQADPSVTPPATVSFTVTDAAATPNTVFSSGSFTVSTTAPSSPTGTFWGAAGTTYTASASTTAANWSPAGQTYAKANPSRSLVLNETGATVKITFSGTTFTGNATVSLVPPTGSGITAPANQTGAVGGTVTFLVVPFGRFGSDWTVNVTATGLTGTATFPVTTANPAAIAVSMHS
ncbi:MAG: hypothetical protein ABI232_02720, partial [Jatrophihabitantaceae bacterium]